MVSFFDGVLWGATCALAGVSVLGLRGVFHASVTAAAISEPEPVPELEPAPAAAPDPDPQPQPLAPPQPAQPEPRNWRPYACAVWPPATVHGFALMGLRDGTLPRIHWN